MKNSLKLITLYLVAFSSTLNAQKFTDTILKAEVFSSIQSLKIGSQNLKFHAKAGTMELRDEMNKPIALHGFTAYFKEDGNKDRPIIFSLMVDQGLHLIGCTWVLWGLKDCGRRS